MILLYIVLYLILGFLSYSFFYLNKEKLTRSFRTDFEEPGVVSLFLVWMVFWWACSPAALANIIVKYSCEITINNDYFIVHQWLDTLKEKMKKRTDK